MANKNGSFTLKDLLGKLSLTKTFLKLEDANSKDKYNYGQEVLFSNAGGDSRFNLGVLTKYLADSVAYVYVDVSGYGTISQNVSLATLVIGVNREKK